MACCLLAALLMAHVMAVLRRWAVFWGLATPRPEEPQDTALRHLRSWLARPAVRAGLACLFAVEVVLGGWWVYTQHGEHLYQLADTAVGRMRGQIVVYAQYCTGGDPGQVRRIVLPRAQH
ncbi:hypothetical protein [Novosphingobium rosa]|uniref:hypothetical protein n=1 Tax=Novosphingobium rosa TaxID=76978 RepID=UPI000A56CC05|nr:hypothetical protein [Novosphingobium rosa]